MCGIFGLVSFDKNLEFKKLINQLFKLSESRGKEASGAVFRSESQIKYIKAPLSSSKLVASHSYKFELDSLIKKKSYNVVIGHSRLVTHGYESNNMNNQPVVANDYILTHNGIVVNYLKLWELLKNSPSSNLDSEVLVEIIRKGLLNGKSLITTIMKLFELVEGTASCAILPQKEQALILFSNNGSLYYCQSKDKKSFIYASENFILKKIIEKSRDFDKKQINRLLPFSILKLSLTKMEFNLFSKENAFKEVDLKTEDKLIKAIEVKYDGKIPNFKNPSLEYIPKSVPENLLKFYNNQFGKISYLKRCSKCILPETYPFITFDNNGVCNFCASFTPSKTLGEDRFIEKMKPFRFNNSQSRACLVPFSGGRDSSFALHYLVKELDIKPIAFSYDWGMLTDLGRRNQARICGALGLEHIIVSADIRKKRKNIRSNVSAWLKRPHLGTIPLFMAGDKQYFYYSKLISSQNQLEVSIMGENNLEKTGFKTGFAGINLPEKGYMSYELGIREKMMLLFFYGKQYLLNPSYFNSSIFDTLKAFTSYYGIQHNHINVFDYIQWNEELIENTIINQYNWEIDKENKNTWRIGDGTTAFYNYIYYIVCGFTENDTFRSNQIREGLISRDEAIKKTNIENQARWHSIQWYFNAIGLDWKMVINKVNSIKKLY